MNQKTLTFVLLPLSALGILFLGIMFHEMTHVVQGKGAESICVDFNAKTNDNVETGFVVAHTNFDKTAWSSTTEFTSWREYSEKWAYTLQWVFYIFAGFIIGMLVTKIQQKKSEN